MTVWALIESLGTVVAVRALLSAILYPTVAQAERIRELPILIW